VRWIRFSQNGRTAYGILEGDRIREVAGDPFAGYETTARAHDLAAVKIEAPVIPRPSTAWSGGSNPSLDTNKIKHLGESNLGTAEAVSVPCPQNPVTIVGCGAATCASRMDGRHPSLWYALQPGRTS
jgi:Domain of unknown function (DUF2437)